MEEIMDPLQSESDEPLEVPNFVHSSNDLDAPKGNFRSTSQVLVGSFALKEEEIADPLQIKNEEPMQFSNVSQSSYGVDAPKSSSCNSSHALIGSFALNEEEIADPLQIKNDESMKVSNFSHPSYGLDTPKSSSCNLSQALVGSLTFNEEGSIRNGRSRKKRSGLVKGISSTGETIWLTSVSNQSKPREKISLKTTVEIEKLTKLTIEENCCGKWRCSDCGKIENTLYFLQLHKSTNCETGLSFICEICREEINNYSDFAIHYIEHEADKEKKCPICLCPNVNNIKEHLIVKKHISEDINGFKFAYDECKRSNKKAKQEVFFNSNIGGYCQDTTAEILPSVETQNMEVSFTTADADTAKLSPVFNHLIPDNQEQDDQGKPEFRRKKNNTLYYKFSDSDINDLSDEETTADMLTTVKTENMDISSASMALDTVKLSPVFSQLMLESEKQEDQGKTDLRGSKPYEINDISDEGEEILSDIVPPAPEVITPKPVPVSTPRKKPRVTCHVCGKSLADAWKLKRHLRSQNKCSSRSWNCGSCEAVYKTELELNDHMLTHPDGFKVDSLAKTSEKKAKKEYLSIVESTPDVEEKPNLRQRKKNTIYVESSDFDIDGTTDEETDRYSEEAYEVMSSEESDPKKIPGIMPPKTSISHIKAINLSSGKRPSLSEEVTLESFDSQSDGMSLWFKENLRIESSENTHFCKICSESFSLRISLSNHMKGHDEIEIQQCQFYRSEFKKKRKLDCCFETQNGTRYSYYECTICKTKYTIRESFLDHMQWHSQLLRTAVLKDKSSSDPVSTNHRGLTCDNLHKCTTCSSTYKYRKGLLRHLQCNPEHRETHFCNIHNKSFSPSRLFQPQTEISKSDIKNEMFQCPFCQIKFKKEHHLCNHLVAHRDKTCNLCIRCNMCSSSFSLPFELLNHIKMHEKTEAASALQSSENSDAESTINSRAAKNDIVQESNFNECGVCKKTFVKRRSFLGHLRKHATGRKYLCYICGLGFFKDIDLKMHIKRHTGDKNFTCDKCGSNFYSMSLLNQHLKKHAIEESGQRPEKMFECEICNTKFETKQGYSQHMKRHNEGATHECGFCQRKFYTSYRLTEHMRTHTGEKPYECKICNNSFTQKQGLNSHMKSHSDKRPYSCELCTKTFKNKNSINDHKNTHTGNKPYKCKQCNMRFGSRKNLKNHKKVHTRNPEEKKFREKKYSCNICNETFAVSDYRDKHVALHANPSPFSCEFCSKSFNYKKNMVAHVQRWHPSCNPFRCKLCSKTYDTIRKIDVHINSRACVKNDTSQKKSKNQGKSTEVDGNTNAENLFICNVCNEDFESVEKIQDHFNSSHKPSK
ncbi:zinc finger protein Xfin-like isoform X2 [Artemia franciscana]|uniref:zinc finger protein Xfin-like isoform X2 n=1 Tax=Artemia franciscana TaxID=6661 RepID=UPI0032D9D38F